MEQFKSRKAFRFITVMVDLAIIYIATFLTYYFFENSLESYDENLYAFLTISPYIGLCYLIIRKIFELDKPKDFTFFGIAYTTTIAIICLLFATMAISFLTRKFAYPRSVLIISSLLQIVLLSFWHLYLNKKYLKASIKKSVMIIGYEKSKELAYKLLRSKGMWSKVQYICDPENKDIASNVGKYDVVFITEDVVEDKKQEIIELCVDKHKMVFYEPKNPEILLFNGSFTQIEDTPVLRIKDLSLSTENNFFKRGLDILLSSLALVIFSIPIIVISVTLKIGGGSIFYRQERVTRFGKVFRIYKFRTMIEDAEALSGPTLAQETDNRITKIGHILRTTRMDELPQIINILRGEMSIVGPRPERPFFVDQFKKDIPEYDLRHRVKAGLTGLAQVQGKYNTPVRDKLKYDLLYINAYSLALDIKLIMQTLNILLRLSSTEGVKDVVNYEEEIKRLTDNKNETL